MLTAYEAYDAIKAQVAEGKSSDEAVVDIMANFLERTRTSVPGQLSDRVLAEEALAALCEMTGTLASQIAVAKAIGLELVDTPPHNQNTGTVQAYFRAPAVPIS